ncbi:MAG: hypothetical protein AB1Z98_39455 [Nannocystaceae bacterium]
MPARALRPRSLLASTIGRGGAVLLAALALSASSGCAKRLALEQTELQRVEKEAGSLQSLRVYVSDRLITVYDEAQVAQDFTVNKQIVQQSDRQQLKNVLGKNTSGKILKVDDSNGMPLLWVTFDASCSEPECAFGFVQNEDGLFRLLTAPPLTGYSEPKNYHVWRNKRRVMKLGKMKSLSEPNDVFVNKKRNGKLRTVHLEVIKVIDDRTRTRIRRSGGVD